MPQLSRKQIQVALFCYATFLVYATLWPFDFHFTQGFPAARKISWIPFFDPLGGPDRKDAMMNILVFFPFGVLSYLANSSSARIRRPVLVATLLGATLSVSVEAAQIGLPSRDPSTADLLMNIMGSLLGALIAHSIRRKLHSAPEEFHLCFRKNAVPLAVIAYALALLASTMRTFDPILNVEMLGIRARAFIGSPLLPDHLDRDYTAWMVLSFGFLSFLLTDWFTGTSIIRRRLVGYTGAFIACSMFAVAIETLQILFRSRDPLLSHALLGIIGVAYGIAWHVVTKRFRVARSPLFLIHYTLILTLAFLSPIPHTLGVFRIDLRGFVPFFFYLRDISLPLFYAAVKAITLYIPVGIMMSRMSDATWNRAGKMPVIYSAGLQTAIEIFKGFSGPPYPDPSNVLLATLGAYVGAVLFGSHLVHSYQEGSISKCRLTTSHQNYPQ